MAFQNSVYLLRYFGSFYHLSSSFFFSLLLSSSLFPPFLNNLLTFFCSISRKSASFIQLSPKMVFSFILSSFCLSLVLALLFFFCLTNFPILGQGYAYLHDPSGMGGGSSSSSSSSSYSSSSSSSSSSYSSKKSESEELTLQVVGKFLLAIGKNHKL